MKKLIVGLMLLVGCGVANAGTILDEVQKLPALKPGIAYSVADQKFNYLSTLELVAYKGFALEAGWAGAAANTYDKVVAVISYDVVNLKNLGVTMPVLDLVDLRLGIYGGFGKVNVGTVPAMRGNNECDYGISMTALNLKF